MSLSYQIIADEEALPLAVLEMLVSVQIRQQRGEPTTGRVRFSTAVAADDYRLADELWTRPGTRLRIGLRVDDAPWSTLFDGFITSIRLGLPPDRVDAFVEIDLRDCLWLLTRHEHTRTFADLTLDEIVDEVLEPYPFTVDRKMPPLASEADGRRIVQTGTDYSFLARLARRYGLELFARPGESNSTIHLHPMRLGRPELPSLAAHLAGGTNLREIEVRETAPEALTAETAEVSVADKGWRLHREPIADTATLMGRENPAQRLLAAVGEALPQEARMGRRRSLEAVDLPEDAARGLASLDAFTTTVVGTVDTDRYRALPLLHDTVAVRGVGDRWSGYYYLTRVDYELTLAGSNSAPHHAIGFAAKRCGIGHSGDEVFDA